MSRNGDLEALFALAKGAQSRAYAPYSRFKVGAAIAAPSGVKVSGCNVENAAYPQGACAESIAIGALVMAGANRIADIVVIGDGDELCTPCGGCRQRIREFADARTRVHVAGPDGIRKSFTLEELLPFAFGPDHLE